MPVKTKSKPKPPAAPAFDPVKLRTVKIDRTEAVQAVLTREPEFANVAEAYAYAAENKLPAMEVAEMYDVLQDAGRAEAVFSSGRKVEYRLGLAERFAYHMPRTGPANLPDFLPSGDESGPSPVAAGSRDGTQAARNYLLTAALAHVRKMLERLHANGQDVRAEAEAFIVEVRRVVEEVALTSRK